MINKKIYSWGMAALVCALAIIGCKDAEPPPLRGGDSVTILGVTPDTLPDGAEQQCAVSVEYTLVHQEYCDLYIAFNTTGLYDFRVHDSHKLTKSGSGSHTFNVAVTSAYWPDGEFQAAVYLGDAGGVGTAVTGTSLAYDSATIPLTDEYWTIAWDLNGGTDYYGAKYTGRVAKGAALPRPSPDPYKSGNFANGLFVFRGWHTDTALTQAYNFAAPVPADLNLRAKWENIPINVTIEDLYGTWIGLSGERYPLTISANGIRWEDGHRGGYVQYTNVVLSPNEDNRFPLIVLSFNIAGTRAASFNHSNTTLDRVSVQWSSINEANGSVESVGLTITPDRYNYPIGYDKQP